MTVDPFLVGVGAAALVAGFLLGWLLAHGAGRRALADAARAHEGAMAAQQTLFSETARRLGDVQDEVQRVREELDTARVESGALREENATLRAELEHQRQIVPEKVALIEKTQEQLKASFDALAGAALRTNIEEFLKLADQKLGNVSRDAVGEIARKQQALDDLLKPIRDTLSQVDQKLGEADKDRVQTAAAISTVLKEMASQQERLRGETRNLVRALRTPVVRGRWGEIQLRRAIELADMVAYCDFLEQPTLAGESGRQRPDVVVTLPGNRAVAVDAKVPLEAYLNAQEAGDDAVREGHLADHARQVREHMVKLGGKQYWEALQPAPDFVVMFLPGEAFFQAALQQDPGLIEFGVRHRVFPASPITLIALLQVIAHGWRQERLAENAEEIRALGRQLYDRVTKLTMHLDTVRQRLDGTVRAFNEAVGSYEGRVLPAARRFKELGAASGADLDSVSTVDSVPRVLQSANLLGLPAEAIVEAEAVTENDE
ncbi:MAG: DNA recombination protein RmuC [Acidobacteriota bacterium]